jgi:hypothetical protein
VYGRYKIKRQTAAWLSLTLFAFYVASTKYFVHSHIVDGKKIVHSHPYSGAADSHGHSSAQFLTIAHLSFISTLAAATLFVLPPAACENILRNLASAGVSSTFRAFFFRLRAPPAL